jgi:tetratricopeptide (TPR) repeat protein
MSDSTRDAALLQEAMTHIDRLLDKPRAERATLLDALAQSRPDVHAVVVQLLEHEDPVGRGYMEPMASAPGMLRADARLGPYKIIRLIGEGGMGEVWLASRDDGLYEGHVAIKTLHPYFAGGALRERFLREARVLGRLAHANIARLLDAGVHEGVVYLVLEYVQGRPIDVACDEEKLDIEARLKIFVQLCAAVAHAHSSLVVHRDIKPGNVLLAADGAPKLLDFGIANIFDPEAAGLPSDLTRLTGRIFTPEYAAPEQILGREITTATDVYSLGVLLYVLLVGRLPYAAPESDRAQWEQRVLTQEPPRMVRALDAQDVEGTAGKVAANRALPLARLRRELGGDLENIVQRALQKRPEDRYATVSAFADDVRRYLAGEPVVARADSAWYRVRKFARRNRLAVGASVAVVVALGIGLAVAVWQLKVAQAARLRAEESKEFIASIFRSADPFYTGKDSMTAVELLALARKRIDRELAAQPENAVELLTLIGESQLNLHEMDAAKETIEKAIEMAERLQPRNDVLIAEARGRLAGFASETGDWARVRELSAQALPDLRKHQPRTGRLLNAMLISLAYAESNEGNPDAAVAHSREGIAAVTAALGPNHSESISGRAHLVTFLVRAEQLDEARKLVEEVLRDAEGLGSPEERRAIVIQVEGRFGSVLIDMGEPQAAIPHFNRALELAAQVYGPNNPSRYSWLGELARAQARLGDFKGLLVTRQRQVDGQEPGMNKSRSLTNFARVTLAARKVPEALERLREAIELARRYDTGKGSWILLAQSDYGAALALSGRFDEADRLLEATLPLARESAKLDSVPSTWNAIGLSRQSQSQWAESERAFREALGYTKASDGNQKQRAEALLGIGIARLELGDAADAEGWFRQADESVRKTFLGMMPLRADIEMNLGRALLAQGKNSAAMAPLAAANDYWLDFDATNRCAGLAAYWAAQGHLAAGAGKQARVELGRAIDILGSSKLPGDVRQVRDARQVMAKL